MISGIGGMDHGDGAVAGRCHGLFAFTSESTSLRSLLKTMASVTSSSSTVAASDEAIPATVGNSLNSSKINALFGLFCTEIRQIAAEIARSNTAGKPQSDEALMAADCLDGQALLPTRGSRWRGITEDSIRQWINNRQQHSDGASPARAADGAVVEDRDPRRSQMEALKRFRECGAECESRDLGC